MIPIELIKRYPHSREEDITDAFMRGYQACAAQGGDAEMDNCQVQAPQNYMQQSRHNDGTDLISRADAIAYIERVINSGLGRSKSLDYIHKYISALPSAEAVQGWIPCSERLPKAEDMYKPPEQRYLCQLEAYGERKFCVLSRLKGAVSPFWDWYGVAVHDSDVIAWMPLPKPYREDGEV